MKSGRDPDHLDTFTSSESDVALARALAALAQDRPTKEELQRVRSRLEAMLNQQTSARARAAIAQPAVGLVIVSAVLLSILPSPAGLPRAVSSQADVYDKAAVGRGSEAAQNTLAAPSPAVVERSSTNEASATSSVPAPTVKHVHATRVEKGGSKFSSLRAQASRQDHSAQAPHEVMDAQQPPFSQKVLESAAAERGASEHQAPLATPVKVADALREPNPGLSSAARSEPDEVTLIQQARKQAVDEPRAALRLLEQHKRRFPHGMLSQEREVLAIQLLRTLSLGSEADKRAQDFRREFPRSIYLSRLGGVGHRE